MISGKKNFFFLAEIFSESNDMIYIYIVNIYIIRTLRWVSKIYVVCLYWVTRWWNFNLAMRCSNNNNIAHHLCNDLKTIETLFTYITLPSGNMLYTPFIDSPEVELHLKETWGGCSCLYCRPLNECCTYRNEIKLMDKPCVEFKF